ncbi:MAG: hypothetical protein VYB54_12740 [Pseudomonadota bacterium]|nr:hypothetical protein [Pseudomonadota bacterium]
MDAQTSLDGRPRAVEKSDPVFASDDDVRAIMNAVLAGTHPYPNWTHAAHCLVTVALLRERPDLDLPRDMPGLIRAYNTAVGIPNTDTDGYHETLTQFHIREIGRLLAALPAGTGLADAVRAVLVSPVGQRGHVFDFYSRARLFSVEARRGWVEPDLKPHTAG